MQTIENLEKELKMGNLKSLYLFYGEELFLLESCLKKIRSLFGESVKGINDIRLDETNYQELIADMETPAFGFEKKIIVVHYSGIFQKEGKRKNAELIKVKERLNEYMKANIKMIESSIVLVFLEQDADPKQEIYNTMDQLGTICKFDFQKPIQIEKRMKAICNAYQVEIEDRTLRYFIECCGTNLQELMNEIRKLIEYAGKNGKCDTQAIDQLAIKKIESIIFDLTDCLGKKEISRALEVLKNLIYAKEPIQKILITLYNHFKKLYLVKLATNSNHEIGHILKLKPNQTFLVGKYKAQASYFQTKELRKILQSLMDLDYQYKSGLVDLQVGLETILCTYCS